MIATLGGFGLLASFFFLAWKSNVWGAKRRGFVDTTQPLVLSFWRGGVAFRSTWVFPDDSINALSFLYGCFILFSMPEASFLSLFFLVPSCVFFWHAHVILKPILTQHRYYRNTKPYSPEESESRQLVKLYRKLAKKYHPDHARTLPQKVYLERMMKLVNRAYSNKDFKALERMATATPFHSPYTSSACCED